MMSPHVHDSAVASQPCPSGHITADKSKIKDFPKLPSTTSFIRKMLSEIARSPYGGVYKTSSIKV